jgi:late competence protein required for DNA uptake (superfamily II DNA/RNA helicase)
MKQMRLEVVAMEKEEVELTNGSRYLLARNWVHESTTTQTWRDIDHFQCFQCHNMGPAEAHGAHRPCALVYVPSCLQLQLHEG